jgi:predicted GIY-YIG superfamily endonuclease
MCKLHNLKNETFVVYHIIVENYIGVTHNLKKRLIKHKSKNKFDVSEVGILLQTTDLNEALKMEEYYQIKHECKKGVRNQNGLKNPYAKQVLHLETGLYFDTIKEASEQLGFDYSSVRKYIGNEKNKYNLIRIN